MEIAVHKDAQALGLAAAQSGATALREALATKESAAIVLATGSSQFAMLEHLVAEPDIDWHRVTGFHLDEYVGLPVTHAASFRRYLWERFVGQLPLPLQAFHYIEGDAENASKEAIRLSRLIRETELDVAFIGIGENGHIAFNDPPADFDTEEPFLIVELDEQCRQQQLNEGWFTEMEAVPEEAISISVHRILTSATIIATVPEARKAEAVRAAVEGDVTSRVPASILQKHEDCRLFLDQDSAHLLKENS